MSLGKAEYYEFLRKMEFNPASYKEIANSLMQNGVIEMYHALVNERDILTLFTIPNSMGNSEICVRYTETCALYTDFCVRYTENFGQFFAKR